MKNKNLKHQAMIKKILNPQANQPQAQAMTTMNPQAQAIACLQITNAYPSTPQAQKNS